MSLPLLLDDTKTRIATALQKIVQLNNIWKDKGIQNTLKVKLLTCLTWPIMIYGCGAWTLKKAVEYNLETARNGVL